MFKTKKWKVSEVGEKEPRRYMTKKRKATIAKKKWGILAITLGLAVVIILGYSNIDNDTVRLNLESQVARAEIDVKTSERYQNEPNLSFQNELDPVKKDIIDVATEKGFDDIALLFHLAKYESGFDPYAIGINKHKSGVVSLDRGTFQINHFYHPSISNKCAFNTRCATNETINIIRRDGGCSAWTTCPY